MIDRQTRSRATTDQRNQYIGDEASDKNEKFWTEAEILADEDLWKVTDSDEEEDDSEEDSDSSEQNSKAKKSSKTQNLVVPSQTSVDQSQPVEKPKETSSSALQK